MPIGEPASGHLSSSVTLEEQRDEPPQGIPPIQTNASGPSRVLCLPADLLYCIFRILFDIHRQSILPWCDDSHTKMNVDRLLMPPSLSLPPWTIVLHVCRDWRMAALSYATLWTHIYTSSPGWTAHFLKFSAQLPLDCHLEALGSTANMEAAKLIGEHSGRIRSISISAQATAGVGFIGDLMDHFLGQAAPKLRSLALTAVESRAQGGPSHISLHILGDFLFSGRVSCLETLRVEYPSGSFLVEMGCPAFRTLTHLVITSPHAWQHNTTAYFLLCLQTWTQLRVLDLKFGLPTDVGDMSSVQLPDRIALPSIEDLRLEDQASFIGNFLAHVSLQPSIDLCFGFMMTDERSPPEEDNARRAAVLSMFAQVSEVIGRPLVHLEFNFMSRNSITNIGPYEATIEIYADPETCPDEVCDMQINFFVGIFGEVEGHVATFQMMLDVLQLSHVRELVLFYPKEYLQVDWLRVLSKLQDVRELHIFAEEYTPLIRALGTARTTASERRDNQTVQTGETEQRLYLPSLQCLQVTAQWTDDLVFDALVQSLKNRMEWGSPLPLLRMRVPNRPLDGDEAKALTEVVSSFVSETCEDEFPDDRLVGDLNWPFGSGEDDEDEDDEDQVGNGQSSDSDISM